MSETSTENEKVKTVHEAQVPGDDSSKFVEIKLAHPLNKQTKEYLGLPVDDEIGVGHTVKVNANGARALINAGIAAIDPEDSDAVRSALRGGPAAPSGDDQPSVEPSSGGDPASGGGLSSTDASGSGSTSATPGSGAGPSGGDAPSSGKGGRGSGAGS